MDLHSLPLEMKEKEGNMQHNIQNRLSESITPAKMTDLYPKYANFARKTTTHCCENRKYETFSTSYSNELAKPPLTLRQKSVSFTP